MKYSFVALFLVCVFATGAYAWNVGDSVSRWGDVQLASVELKTGKFYHLESSMYNYEVYVTMTTIEDTRMDTGNVTIWDKVFHSTRGTYYKNTTGINERRTVFRSNGTYSRWVMDPGSGNWTCYEVGTYT